MSNVSSIQTNFTGGEISPVMLAREDFEKYYNSCKTLRNFIPFPQGGIMKRPGTVYAGEAKTEGRKVRLVPFEFSTEQAYVLEFGHEYIRYWKNGGQILGGGTSIVTNGEFNSDLSGWTQEEQGMDVLWDSSGACRHKLINYDINTGYSIGWLAPRYGRNIQSLTLAPSTDYIVEFSVSNMNIPYTSSSTLFADVYLEVYGSTGGSVKQVISQSGTGTYLFYINSDDFSGTVNIRSAFEIIDVQGIFTTTSNVYFDIDNIRVYAPTGAAEDTSTYSEGELNDLQFCQSADTLFIAHPNHAPATLVRNSDVDWVLSDITFTAQPLEWGTFNYPGSVSFFEDRLCWSSVPSEPRRIWMSQTGDYTNLTVGTGADDAVDITAVSNQVNAIRWMVPRRQLVCGTSSGLNAINGGGIGTPITPSSVKASPETDDRAGSLQPIGVNREVIYVDLYGKGLFSGNFDWQTDSYRTIDLSILAQHITLSSSIISMAYQQYPYPTVWCVLSSGILASLTYIPEQNILAWATHDTDGSVESVCSIPGRSGEDEVWISVLRSGSSKRYLEYFANEFTIDQSRSINNYTLLDSSLRYSNGAVSSVSGLTHLASQDVSYLADGVAGTGTVSAGGVLTLPSPASNILVGLPYDSILNTIDYKGGSSIGTSTGKTKTINNVNANLYRSGTFNLGSDVDHLETYDIDGLTSELYNIGVPNVDWDDEAELYISQPNPYPLTLLGLVIDITVNEHN